MREPVYEVIWPLGKSVYQTGSFERHIPDLHGKTICELSDHVFRTEAVFPMIRELLQRRYSDISFVEYDVFGDTHGPKEREVIAALPDLLHSHGCDAVISGIGG